MLPSSDIKKRRCLAAAILACFVAAGCANPLQSAGPASQSVGTQKNAGALLNGTSWRLVEIQSMDDATGTLRPDDRNQYTLELRKDGVASLRLGCNRATGSWTAESASDRNSNRFIFGPLAGTRAMCPPQSLDSKIMAQAPYVRAYLLRNGRLHLSLMADGGILVWEPAYR
jgi:heat shock protein HslJ